MTELRTEAGRALLALRLDTENGSVPLISHPEWVLAIEAEAAALDVERLAKVAIEPYEDDPARGRCRVCGEDGQTVGVIENPDDLAAEYDRLTKG